MSYCYILLLFNVIYIYYNDIISIPTSTHIRYYYYYLKKAICSVGLVLLQTRSVVTCIDVIDFNNLRV